MKYAIQLKENGRVIDYCETKEQAKYWLSNHPVELVDTSKASKVSVEYTELGGPWGYGHQEESFATFGALKNCISNLYKWMQDEARIWGPDARDVRDYFRHCSLTINGEDKTSWLLRQVDRINVKSIYA